MSGGTKMNLKMFARLRTNKKVDYDEIELFSLDSLTLSLKNGKTFYLVFTDYVGEFEKKNGLLIYEVEQCELEDCWDDCSIDEPEEYESSTTITWDKLKGATIEDFELTGEEDGWCYTSLFTITEVLLYDLETKKEMYLVGGNND